MPIAEPMGDNASIRVPARAVIVAAAALAGSLAAAAAALWAHYGTAIFFEMIRTGFMSCF